MCSIVETARVIDVEQIGPLVTDTQEVTPLVTTCSLPVSTRRCRS
jgi:hypothetical protein